MTEGRITVFLKGKNYHLIDFTPHTDSFRVFLETKSHLFRIICEVDKST